MTLANGSVVRCIWEDVFRLCFFTFYPMALPHTIPLGRDDQQRSSLIMARSLVHHQRRESGFGWPLLFPGVPQTQMLPAADGQSRSPPRAQGLSRPCRAREKRR